MSQAQNWAHSSVYQWWMLQVREYLEKHYAETSGKETIKLALKSLMETVEAGSKNVEVTH